MGANKFKREILFYGDEYWKFYHKQNYKVRKKIDWTIALIRDIERIPEQYWKHITGTDLYEIRVISGNNIFRIFSFFDKGKLVIVLNGFQKKTQKTPKGEIQKALNLKKQYENDKAK